MEVACRDLGLMDYKDCWELQQSLFDLLIARKAARKGMAGQPAGYTAASDAATAPHAATAQVATTGAGKTAPGTSPEPASGSGGSAAQYGERGGKPCPADGKTAPEAIVGDDPGNVGTILLVEHPPVFTLGKSGHAENLLVGREALEAMGAQFFHIDRGGDITFHGPGQLVCYPILDLERLGIGLRGYIEALEEAVIRTVAEYGITAGRIAGASGVWVGGSAESTGTAGRADIRIASGAKADRCAQDAGKYRNGAEGYGGAAGQGNATEGHPGTAGHGNSTEGVPDDTDGYRQGAARHCEDARADRTGRGGVATARGGYPGAAPYGIPQGGNRMSGGAPRKICAIGVRSSRYITMHGFALNVTTDLEWFSRINPCGFTDRGATSIERETGRKVAMDEVKGRVVKFLSEILNVRIYK